MSGGAQSEAQECAPQTHLIAPCLQIGNVGSTVHCEQQLPIGESSAHSERGKGHSVSAVGMSVVVVLRQGAASLHIQHTTRLAWVHRAFSLSFSQGFKLKVIPMCLGFVETGFVYVYIV